MLKQTSGDFRINFILEFTKEIIRGTKTYRETIVKKEVKKILHKKTEPQKIIPRIDIPLVVHEKIKADSKRVRQLRKAEQTGFIFKQKPSVVKLTPHIPPSLVQRRRGYIKIPELRLPETVSYLRPMPTSQYIDLGKLDSLIKDSLVRTIECYGPGEKIVVNGLMGRKNTGIILSREEIDDIIARFSEATRIPVFEGVFRVVFGRLILTAIVSEVTDPVFIITKMPEFYVPAAPLYR